MRQRIFLVTLILIVAAMAAEVLIGCGNRDQKTQDSSPETLSAQKKATSEALKSESLNLGESTTDDLRVRVAPYLDAEILTQIDTNVPFRVIARTSWQVEIDGIESYWLKIGSEGVRGWSFGGYISLQDDSLAIEDLPSDRVYILPRSEQSTDEKSQDTAFNPQTFIDRPFTDATLFIPPESLNSLDTLRQRIDKPINIERKKIQNRHTPGIIDEQISIQTEQYFLYYYYVTTKDVYYRRLLQIRSASHELKFGIKMGMTEEDLASICGSPSRKIQHENKYELIYYGSEFGQVNFVFKTGVLEAINLWTAD